MVPEVGSSLAKCDDLGVSCWIMIHQIAIEPASDNPSILDDHSANRYLASCQREPCLLQGKLHAGGIIARLCGTAIL